MLKVFLRLILLIAVLLAIVAGIGSMLPRSFRIEQTILIDAPIEVVFAKVNDLHQWLRWSPWRPETLGADKIQIGEPSSGNGAKFFWDDPRGTGKLWFTDVRPGEWIDFEFQVAQFRELRGRFLFVPDAHSTRVTWTCEGKLPGGPFYGFFGFMFHGEMNRQFQESLKRLQSTIQ